MSDPASAGGAALPVHPILILKIPKSGPVYVRFLGPGRFLATHYKGKQPMCCRGEPPACSNDRHKFPYRPKWWAPAQAWIAEDRVWRSFVVEITEALERRFRGESLRGSVWMLYRQRGDVEKQALMGELLEVVDPDTLPPAFDVDPTLKRLFSELELPSPKLPNLLAERSFGCDQTGAPPTRLAEQEAKEAATRAAPRPRVSLGQTFRQGNRAPVHPLDQPGNPPPGIAPEAAPTVNGTNGTH